MGRRALGGRVRNPPREDDPSYFFRSPTIGGDGPPRCQVNPKIQANSEAGRGGRPRLYRIGAPNRDLERLGVAAPSSARVAGPVGAVGIDVERPRRTFDDLPGDDDLLHPFEAG